MALSPPVHAALQLLSRSLGALSRRSAGVLSSSSSQLPLPLAAAPAGRVRSLARETGGQHRLFSSSPARAERLYCFPSAAPSRPYSASSPPHSSLGAGGAAPLSPPTAAGLPPPTLAPPPLPPLGSGLGALIVTAAAQRRLALVRSKRIADGASAKLLLRVVVEGGGCQGFQYRLALEHGDPAPEDVAVPAGEATHVVVDGALFANVAGCTIDFVEAMERVGFAVINNPNAGSSCSCGASFAPKD